MTNQLQAGLLTFVIPNYNYGQFIAEAIQCVANQDYAPIELIVVDDCSTDNSVEVIRETVAGIDNLARIKVIEAPENRGKLGAINQALPEIRGEYCIILDSDDFLTLDYASRCVAELTEARKSDPSIGFVYSDCMLVNADSEEIDRGKSTEFSVELLEIYSYIPEPALVRSEAMIEAGPFDETIRRGTKHHKWRRMVGNGWMGKHIPEAMFCYRMHDNNISGIGKKVIAEVDSGERGHRILSGYWPTEADGKGDYP